MLNLSLSENFNHEQEPVTKSTIDADRVQVGHQITNYRAYPRFEIKFERGPGISEYTVTMFQTVLGNLQPYMEIFRPFIQKKNQFFSHFSKNNLTI